MDCKSKKEDAKKEFKHLMISFGTFIKWVCIAVVVGTITGGVSILFGKSMNFATSFRQENPWIIYFLPLAGVFIVALYRLCRYENNTGTNIVLSNLHAHSDIPFKTAPLIFACTVMTHLFGGSAGREGAALQIGGSFGNLLGKIISLDDNDRRVAVMCGMSAAFSALFGTPMAAAIFSIEIGSVGIMHYSALVPCVFAAVVASQFAVNMGIRPENFNINEIPALNMENVLKVLCICVIFAVVSALFCIVLHKTGHIMKEKLKNSYVRIIIAAVVIVAATKLLGTTDYLGAGIDVIDRAMEGDVVPYAFALKMLFTAVTLGAGFKGGEIVPSFFIGATLGAYIGTIFGLPVSFCAALGMTAVFCGVTNCPVSSLLISFELFGYGGQLFFMMAVAVSFVLSGYYGLYSEQKIMYSKSTTQYINRQTNL